MTSPTRLATKPHLKSSKMRQFHELFVGRTDAYGTYALPKGQTAKRGTKFLGKAKTHTNGNLTINDYREHVKGITGLGIVPIIPPDDFVSWFVIDVDLYGEKDLHGEVAKRINKLNLPLVICNSKSYGAHLYCFLTEPAPAKDVRKIAKKFVKKLNLDDDTEIFPKQDKSVEAGSWINLPYFGDTRKCMGKDGHTELTLKEFILFVHEMEVHPSDLEIRIAEVEQRSDDSTSKAPPCIDRMIAEGVEEGGRDLALTHVGVYMKKRYPDDWQDRVGEFNSVHINPSLPFGDVSRIVKSNERRDYQYMCKQQPMCSLCDQQACLRREFGIGSGEDELDEFVIDSVRKICTEEPIYIVVVDGKPMRLKGEEIFNYAVFRQEFFKQCDRVLKFMKPEEWKVRLNDAMLDLEKEEAPEIVGESGQIRHHFMEWTGQMMQVRGLEAALEGYPFYKDKTFLFRGTDFISYLKRSGGRYEDRFVWLVLNEDGAEQIRKDIKGSTRSLWSYPVGEPWFEPPEKKETF